METIPSSEKNLLEIIKSKTGKTACQISYEEKALCSFWRLDESVWYLVAHKHYNYDEKGPVKREVRKQLEKIEKKDFEPIQCEVSMSEGML